MTNTSWTPPKHAVYDDDPSIGLFTCVCGRSYASPAELYRHASTGTAQTRSPARYRIRKNGDRWITYRNMGTFGWWPIAGHATWPAALVSVNRRIRRERGTQSDYALAGPGDAR
ncbi:hypothetical protein GS474_23825 [Rhodococcus hoagii]|nr:hypothetical protein [Prescottella equi]